MSSQRSSSNGGPINSAPPMGGAAWTNAEISSESDCGRTRELGSGGSSSPHARATKDCPMSRQYDSVGWRSLPSSPAPRCRTPWPRPVPNALRIRCCVAADIVRSPLVNSGRTSMHPLGVNPQTSVESVSEMLSRERCVILESWHLRSRCHRQDLRIQARLRWRLRNDFSSTFEDGIGPPFPVQTTPRLGNLAVKDAEQPDPDV